MADRIVDVDGIGPKYAETLGTLGIKTTEDRLIQCGSAAGRKKAAEAIGISEKLLLTWANLADLMRINGIGTQYAELLEAAGVDTVKELRTRRADNLAARMVEIQTVKKLTRKAPSEKEVAGWIEEAKTLEPRVTH